MKKLLSGNLLLLFILLFTSCSNEDSNKTDFLYGKWEIDTAYRNGNKTELLTGLFFEFSADGNMRTNITGNPESVRFEIEENNIAQREGRIDLDYEIVELNDSSLIIKTSIRNSKLQLNLKKLIPEISE